jgi:hypothetical protein
MLGIPGSPVPHDEDMKTKALGALIAVTVGAVMAVGASAAAVAVLPGDTAGEVQNVSAIAVPGQSAADGAATASRSGSPVPAGLPNVGVLDRGPEPTSEPAPVTTESPVADPDPVSTSGPDVDVESDGKKDDKEKDKKEKKDKKDKQDKHDQEKQDKKDQHDQEKQDKKDKHDKEKQDKDEHDKKNKKDKKDD